MDPGSFPQDTYLSVHIPKTAGVTIRNVLKEHFAEGFVLHYWEITDAWGRVREQVPAEATCVHGHYQTDKLAGLFPHARLITWVRDPVERVVSSYHHRLRDPDPRHPVCTELHEKRLSLLEYAALPLVRNEMSHFFGTKQVADFHFIGVVEDFDRSFARLTQLLGLPGGPAPRDNVNPDKKTSRYALEPKIREKILELNERDAALYEACRRMWD
jgi:hypothetical protein